MLTSRECAAFLCSSRVFSRAFEHGYLLHDREGFFRTENLSSTKKRFRSTRTTTRKRARYFGRRKPGLERAGHDEVNGGTQTTSIADQLVKALIPSWTKQRPQRAAGDIRLRMMMIMMMMMMTIVKPARTPSKTPSSIPKRSEKKSNKTVGMTRDGRKKTDNSNRV